MLILHGSLHILVAHGPHDGSQVSRSLQNPGAVIMPPTIEDKIFGKPSFDPGFAKSLRPCGEVSRVGTVRWENPSFAPSSARCLRTSKTRLLIGTRLRPSSVLLSGRKTTRVSRHIRRPSSTGNCENHTIGPSQGTASRPEIAASARIKRMLPM